jgi:hypothetical protein
METGFVNTKILRLSFENLKRSQLFGQVCREVVVVEGIAQGSSTTKVTTKPESGNM